VAVATDWAVSLTGLLFNPSKELRTLLEAGVRNRAELAAHVSKLRTGEPLEH
jgi:hypothetical protein